RTSVARSPVAAWAASEFQVSGDHARGAAPLAEVARRTATAARLYAALDGSCSGDAPGSMGRPRREWGSAKLRTRPHSAPAKLWTSAGTAARLCGWIAPRASGCQKAAFSTVEPAAWTIRGWFGDVKVGSA